MKKAISEDTWGKIKVIEIEEAFIDNGFKVKVCIYLDTGNLIFKKYWVADNGVDDRIFSSAEEAEQAIIAHIEKSGEVNYFARCRIVDE